MRYLALLLTLTLGMAACGGDASQPSGPPDTGRSATVPVPAATVPSTPDTAPPSSVPAPPERWTVTLEVDPVEGLALGPGVAISVGWPGGSAEIPAGGAVEVSGVGEPPAEFTLAYPEPARGTGALRWTQALPPGERLVVRQPWRGVRAPAAGGVVLAWQSGGDAGEYAEQLDAAPGLTVASPLWWFLGADGSLQDRSDGRLVAAASGRGIDLWPALASLDADAIAAGVGDPDRRAALARGVAERAAELRVGGVNVDLEGFLDETGPAVTAFVVDLAGMLHEEGMLLSVDITPRSDSWVITPHELDYWSTAPERRALSAAADYVVLMAYDQFNSHRPAGPVASPAWVEEVLRYQLRYTDPNRLLLGVPFYFRLWDPARLDKPRAISVGAIERFAAGGTRQADPEFGLDRVDLPDGTYLWFEDAAGLVRQRDLVERYGLAGLAGWRLGLDSPETWTALAGG